MAHEVWKAGALAMSLIDLTHTLSPDMPVYPGTAPPTFKSVCSLEADGLVEKELSFFSHTGTHVDAPAHLLDGAATLDQLTIDHFHGEAFLLKVDRSLIGVEILKSHEEAINRADFLILETGWCQYWGTEQYFGNFPTLSPEAAQWLTGRGLKGVGVDAISFDPMHTRDYVVHKTLLGDNMLLVENLTNLAAVETSTFQFFCLPLKIEQADGSPVRAVAYLG
jgi:arylformamidase